MSAAHGPGGLAVETSALTKVFGKTRAVDGVSLAVPAGCVHGFLGPNGAGKTTTLPILATLLRPDGGTARVFGHDVVREAGAVRRRVALTGQFASVDEDLTARENLLLLARLLSHSRRDARARAGELLAAFCLAGAAARQVLTLAGGMRRRMDIAASLAGSAHPDVPADLRRQHLHPPADHARLAARGRGPRPALVTRQAMSDGRESR